MTPSRVQRLPDTDGGAGVPASVAVGGWCSDISEKRGYGALSRLFLLQDKERGKRAKPQHPFGMVQAAMKVDSWLLTICVNYSRNWQTGMLASRRRQVAIHRSVSLSLSARRIKRYQNKAGGMELKNGLGRWAEFITKPCKLSRFSPVP